MRMLLTLSVLMLTLGCGGVASDRPEHPTAPKSIEQHPGSGGVGSIPPELEQLFPPDQDVYVVRLAQDANAVTVASELGLPLLDSIAANYALMQGPADPSTILAHPAVLDVEENLMMQVADGQDLTMGYLEEDFDPFRLVDQAALRTLRRNEWPEGATGERRTVAVLDTGVDPDHSLFAGRLVLIPETSMLTSIAVAEGIDEDGDGLVDEGVHHGTHVAGIVAQVAPDAKILPVRVLNSDGFGSIYDIVRGLMYVREFVGDHGGIDVVNLSLRLSASSSLFDHVMEQLTGQGIVVVAAAGNSEQSAPYYPASSQWSTGVLATDNLNAAADFSCVGRRVSIGAPGTGVLSAMPDEKMAGLSGTSMATPVVSALVVVVQEYFDLSAFAAKDFLLAGGFPLEQTKHSAYGRADPFRTFQNLITP